MTTYKSGKIQVTFVILPETRERLKEAHWQERRSEGEIFREAMEFYFSELDQRNPRHPVLVHEKTSTKKQRAA